MPSECSEKGPQRTGYDHADGPATAPCIRPQRAHRRRRQCEGDRRPCLDDLDRRVQLGRFFEVTISLTQRQTKLAHQTLRGLGQRNVALEQAIRRVQLTGLIR